jgi:hypothetical protein
MRHYIVSPVIGGLVAIIVIGLFMHDGASSFGRSRGMLYQSSYQPSSCNFAVSSESLSPTLVGAVIRSGVHC